MVGVAFAARVMRMAVVAAIVAAAPLLVATPSFAVDANYAAIVIDGNTGRVLFSRQADATRYPASLTKMMTLYLLFEDLERGRFSLTSRLSVSSNAANQAPSKLGVAAGSTIRVEDAILALITRSANDVAMVIAENLAGSQSAFASRMTTTARAIGMAETTFRNPHGLPDSGQVTTARDMATLGRALQDRFPQYYHYFSAPSFTWQGVRINNHNNLLGIEGVDGIKTGYTRASGYNLVTSIHRDGRYLVAVVMGGDSASSRDAHMRDLIATNLPRASDGPRSAPLVATRAMDFVPVPRPVTAITNDPVVTAAIPPAPVVPVPAGPVPVAPVPAPVVAQGDIDPTPVALALGPPAPGWRIQIGAFPSEANAVATLADAAAAEGTILAAVTPYTETVTVGGVLHYRARFSGFANSDAAEAACDRLERHGFACFATQ